MSERLCKCHGVAHEDGIVHISVGIVIMGRMTKDQIIPYMARVTILGNLIQEG